MKRILILLVAATPILAQTGTGPCTASASFSTVAAAEINNKACATETFTVGSGGVTANTVVITDTSNPAKVIAGTGSGAYGIAVSTVSATGSVQVERYGQVPCVMDNTATAGDLVIPGTSTVIDCRDSGQTTSSAISSTTRIVGVLLTSATAGQTAIVELSPAHYGTRGAICTASFSPFTGSIQNLTVSGCITGVTYSATGLYTVALSGVPRSNWVMTCTAGATGSFLAICQNGDAGLPVSNSSTTIAASSTSGLADPKVVFVVIQ